MPVLIFRFYLGRLFPMKTFISILVCLSCLQTVCGAVPADSAAHTNSAVSLPLVIVIPVEGMIERGLLYVIRRSLADAVREEAAVVILDMDTPGGRVDVTEEIMRLLMDLPDSIRTITYVNKDALSAGALITASTGRIYMAPGSRIGASAIVGPTGDIEDGDLKEKHVSSLVALARSAAESNGHDPDLIEAMIRKEMEYSVGGEVVSKAGQLLTLTDRDASRRIQTEDGEEKPLLALDSVASLDELMKAENLAGAVVRVVRLTNAERVARYIELFSFIFLAGGLLGIYIEFKTPGFGLPGILGALLLAVFFWGHRIAGVSGDIELILFAVGALLLVLELLVIPGFGFAGISGMVLIFISVFFSMVKPTPGMEWFRIPVFQLEDAFQNLALGLALALAAGWATARFLPKSRGFQRLVLNAALAGAGTDASVAVLDVPLPGSVGKAVTALHPAGYALINGKRLNVVAQGAFINEGSPVVITEVHGNRMVVDFQKENFSAKGKV